MKKSLSMGAGLIDHFIRNILSVPFCPYHFVHTIFSNTILSIYHFVHTILSVPFCPLPFCPRTGGGGGGGGDDDDDDDIIIIIIIVQTFIQDILHAYTYTY